ncbi:MAG: VPLPA-CTERM sorting domain-containing protein [Amphritea sp.]|nr:VPLPA-CTERM sorting domain-containing protein [Amphritea sp.]
MNIHKMSEKCKIVAVALTILGAFSNQADASLIVNGGFENVPSSQTGQGIMPSDWVSVSFSPDTYSNDGSYGLSPSDFNNWPVGMTAFEGNRWVAGGRIPGLIESFGQFMTTPLTVGSQYELSGYLHQSTSRNNPGGYDIFLSDDASGSNRLFLGFLGSTNNVAEGWTSHSLLFEAPTGADNKPFILFEPSFVSIENIYPGLDAVVLNAVPVPAAVWLFGSGLLGLVGVARRKKA